MQRYRVTFNFDFALVIETYNLECAGLVASRMAKIFGYDDDDYEVEEL